MSAAPAELVRATLDPIDLAELNARAALQTRVDSKYLLTGAQFARLVELLAGRFVALAIDGQCDQPYDTTYFDTPGLRNYRDHLQRRRRTFKLRTRTYVSSGICGFEVKMRDGRGTTVKKRQSHDGARDELTAAARRFSGATLLAHYGPGVDDADATLVPVLHNVYHRLTLAAHVGAERVTVDHDLHFRDVRTGVVAASLASDAVLIETKTASGAGTIDHILWGMGARPSRVSKYCIGLGLTLAGGASSRYARASRGWFAPATASARTARPWLPPADAPDVSLVRPPRAPRPPRPRRAPRGQRPLRDADALD